MSILRRLVEKRVLTDSSFAPHPSQTGFVHAGEPVNESSALSLVAYYAAVRLLADTIASLPWDAYRRRGGQQVELDPAPALLRDPYGMLTEYEWKHQMTVSLAMRGNFYGLIVERDWLEFPTQIQPLHPDWVLRDHERVAGRMTGRVVTRVLGEVIPEADLFHIRGFTPPGAYDGLSPINLARHSIGLGLATQRFGSQWFADGAAPSGQLITDQELNQEQITRNQEQWIATHGGRRLPAVMTGGMKYEPISITPEESQFLQTRDFTIKEMAMLVGVPPHMIGDVERSTSWGTGIEQQSIGFVTYNLRSWLTSIESAVSKWLLPRGQHVKFNVDALLRGDLKSRYEAYRVALEAGFKNPDEVRELEDLPPIPDGAGQQFRQPLNFGPLGQEADDDERS